MMLQETLHIVTQAMKNVFNSDYPEQDFRDLHIGIEFPAEEQAYPGIWVDFEITDQLQIAGIDQREYSIESPLGDARQWKRWRFSGDATYTIVTLSNLQRARLFDEVIRVIAFGDETQQTSVFRSFIEDNEFIAANMNFDEIPVRGFSASPGTPWGTDEIVYEVTVAIQMIGEFVSDGLSTTLVPLSSVAVDAFGPTDPDTTLTDHNGAWR